MAQNSKTPDVSRQEQMQLVRQSEGLLRLGWLIGPLEGQRGCCVKSAKEMAAAKVGENRLTLSQMTTPVHRCKSHVCRPGDPYGCSMAHARGMWSSISTLIEGWQKAGHFAYVGQLEVKGQPGQELKPTLKAARLAMKYVLGGDAWRELKVECDVVGQISALEVAKTRSGSWVVRRWLIFCTARELLGAEEQTLSDTLHSRWSRDIQASDSALSARSVALRLIMPAEVGAITQYIAKCESPFEPPEEPYASSIKLEFEPSEPEDSIVELAERYREATVELKRLFADVGREEYIAMKNRGFVFKTDRRGQTISRSVELPKKASDFMEYAVRLYKVPVWTAYKRRNPKGVAVIWNSLVDEARSIKSRYIEYEYDTSRRKFKKV